MKAAILKIIEDNGYIRKGYKYIKNSPNNTHLITVFTGRGVVRMYAYYTGDEECERIYDTGKISVSNANLGMLIGILNLNHK